jgi:hypothetical protein
MDADKLEELERLNAGRTQGVWRLHRLTDGTLVVVDGEEPQRVVASGRTPEDAALICAAINALEELVEMARRVAELEAALKPFAEARLVSWGQRTQGVGDFLTSVWINTDPNKAVAVARAALKGPTT